MKRSFIREILESINKDTISFAGGLPNESLFPIEDLKEANIKVYEKQSNLQYSISSGLDSLKEKIANFYNKDGFETTKENILITTGSQQALYILANYFKNRDIIIEEPSYLGAINVFKASGLNMFGVKLDHDGIDLNRFEDIFKKVKLAYLIPDYQNPTGACYSKYHREEIAKIVLKNGGYIIEDAPYSMIYFKNRQKSISSLLPNNSFHLGSFSKILSPSFRVGWIRADKEIILKLTQIKETIDLHTSTISQLTINNYLEDERRFDSHLKSIRLNYLDKLKYFQNSLKKHLASFKYKTPNGGMFVYGSLDNIDTFKLVKKCIKDGVVFVPGNQFYLDKNQFNSEIRFNFTNTNKYKVDIGLEKIAKIVDTLR